MADLPVVMISSTARDLPEHRKAVERACMEQEMFPRMMEHLTATHADAREESLAMLEGAELFVGIYAWRYGYIPDGYEKSVTEMEYDGAAELGIPRIVFLSADDFELKHADVEEGTGATKVQAFRDRVAKENVVGFFTTSELLYGQVAGALAKARRTSGAGGAGPGARGRRQDLGEVFGVPPVRRAHLDRPEVIREITEALAASRGEPVCVTATVPALGVGKAVQAAAAVTSERVRSQFPDGIHWLEVDGGDAKGAQNALASQIALEDFESTPTERARLELLRTALRGRASLLVLNHVRTSGVVQALDVVDREAGGRMLCTADDPGALRADVRMVVVEPLSADAAEELLRRAAGFADAWPEGMCAAADIERILAATGGIPFVLAGVGAVLRSGRRTCGSIADELERPHGRLPEPGDAEEFRFMRTAMASLAGPEARDDAERFHQLAVFPEGEPIPETEVRRLWEVGPEDARSALGRLAEARLVSVADDGVRVGIKPSLLLLEETDVARLNDMLVRVYGELCETPGDWSTLDRAEGYAWDHLVFHAEGTGDRRLLAEIVCDMGFLARHAWISGPHAVERDLDLAADAVAADAGPTEPPIPWLRRFIGTAGHLLAGHPDEASLAASLRLLLVAAPPGIALDHLDGLLPPVFLEPLWRRPTRLDALVREACPCEHSVDALAWSAEGQVAVATADAALRIWSVRLGDEPLTIDVTPAAVTAMAFLADGRLACGRSDGRVELRTADGDPVVELEGHPGTGVSALAVADDGSWVASCGGDGSVRVSAPGGGPGGRVLEGRATALAALPGGRHLALGGPDGTVRVHGATGGGEWMPPQPVADGPVTALAVSRDGRLLAAGEGLDGLAVWELSGDDASLARTPWEFPREVVALEFSPAEDDLLALGCDDGSVLLWRLRDGAEPTLLADDPGFPVRSLAFAPNGRRLVSGDAFGRLRVWDVEEAESHRAIEQEMEGVSAVAISPNGVALATGGADGLVAVRRAAGGDAPPERLGERGAKVTMVVFSADSRCLAWGSSGARAIGIAPAARPWWRLRSPSPANAIALSPQGDRIAASCADGVARTWSTADDGSPPLELPLSARPAATAIVYPAAGRVLLGGREGLLAWDPEGGTHETLLEPGDGEITALAASPVDGAIAVGRRDGSIEVVSPDGRGRSAAPGHPDAVNALAFSEDGSLLASAAEDGTAQLVDLAEADILVRADAGVRGMGLAWAGGSRRNVSGSRMAHLLDGAVLLTEMVDRR